MKVYFRNHLQKDYLSQEINDLKNITVSVNVFMEQITKVKTVEWAQTALRLNVNGTSKVEYRIGDQVSFFLSPSEEVVRWSHGQKKETYDYYFAIGQWLYKAISHELQNGKKLLAPHPVFVVQTSFIVFPALFVFLITISYMHSDLHYLYIN